MNRHARQNIGLCLLCMGKRSDIRTRKKGGSTQAPMDNLLQDNLLQDNLLHNNLLYNNLLHENLL